MSQPCTLRAAEEEAALAPETNALAPENLPPQLLFVHGGQTDMKEMHWHPQVGDRAAGGRGMLGGTRSLSLLGSKLGTCL